MFCFVFISSETSVKRSQAHILYLLSLQGLFKKDGNLLAFKRLCKKIHRQEKGKLDQILNQPLLKEKLLYTAQDRFISQSFHWLQPFKNMQAPSAELNGRKYYEPIKATVKRRPHDRGPSSDIREPTTSTRNVDTAAPLLSRSTPRRQRKSHRGLLQILCP